MKTKNATSVLFQPMKPHENPPMVSALTFFAADSSSLPSPTTTYVHFRPKRETILSKQLSLPGKQRSSHAMTKRGGKNKPNNWKSMNPDCCKNLEMFLLRNMQNDKIQKQGDVARPKEKLKIFCLRLVL